MIHHHFLYKIHETQKMRISWKNDHEVRIFDHDFPKIRYDDCTLLVYKLLYELQILFGFEKCNQNFQMSWSTPDIWIDVKHHFQNFGVLNTIFFL